MFLVGLSTPVSIIKTSNNVHRYSYKDAYTHSFGCFAPFFSLSFALHNMSLKLVICAHIQRVVPTCLQLLSDLGPIQELPAGVKSVTNPIFTHMRRTCNDNVSL